MKEVKGVGKIKSLFELSWLAGKLGVFAIGFLVSLGGPFGLRGAYLPGMMAKSGLGGAFMLLGGAVSLIIGGLSPYEAIFLSAAAVVGLLRTLFKGKDGAGLTLLISQTAVQLSLMILYIIRAESPADQALRLILGGIIASGLTYRLASIKKEGLGGIFQPALDLGTVFYLQVLLSSLTEPVFPAGLVILLAASAFFLGHLPFSESNQLSLVLTCGYLIGSLFVSSLTAIGTVTGLALTLLSMITHRIRSRAALRALLASLMYLSVSLLLSGGISLIQASAAVAAFLLALILERYSEKIIWLFGGADSPKQDKRPLLRARFMSGGLESFCRLLDEPQLDESGAPLIEDMVYASVCIDCEHESRCFERGDRAGSGKRLCPNFSKVASCTGRLMRQDVYPGTARDSAREKREAFLRAVGSLSETAASLKLPFLLGGSELSALGLDSIEAYYSDGVCELYANSWERLPCSRLAGALSRRLGERLELSHRSELSGVTRLIFSKKPVISVYAGCHKIPRLPYEESGDMTMEIRIGDYQYILLSDGMGSGSRAAECSGFLLCAVRELLSAGFELETAVRLSAQSLSLKMGEEMIATLEILRISLQDSSAELFKWGEAQSYHIREGGEIAVHPGAGAPLGILPAEAPGHYSLELAPGDVIVLTSDGGGGLSAEDILSFYLESGGAIPSELASKICKRAIKLQTESSRDDVTCVVIEISGI